MRSPTVSWCRVEGSLQLTTKNADRIANLDGFNVRQLSDSMLDTGAYPDHCKNAPSLTAVSISLKTVMNYQKNVNEIVVASMIVYPQGLFSCPSMDNIHR
jgi:hypothetical protein